MDIVSNENNLSPLQERIKEYSALDANKGGNRIILGYPFIFEQFDLGEPTTQSERGYYAF